MQAHEKRSADVLIADLFMPERDGLETLIYFRARNPDMRIVVLSGWKRAQKADHLAVAASRRGRHLAQAFHAG